jgi:3-oxoadipate enol-lactonase
LPTLNLQDASLHYEFNPSIDKPVLLLSNSLGTSIELWSQQIEAFSEYFSVLRYDIRGQGLSSTPAGPYSIEQMSKDVLALLDSLEVERAHFCGISMGGLIGQWLGVHVPDRLRKLVLCNTAAKIGTESNWNQRIATVGNNGLAPIVPAVLKGWFTEQFFHDQPGVITKMESILRANQPEGYAASCAAVRDADFRHSVHSIATPALVVYGTEDRSTTADEAQFLLNRIKGSRALKLHAAHISNIEAASAFTSGVLQFLREGAALEREA